VNVRFAKNVPLAPLGAIEQHLQRLARPEQQNIEAHLLYAGESTLSVSASM
jgi:hypothetical protein